MLDELVAYAHQNGLSSQRGYAPKDVRWAIDLATDGTFLGLTELGNPEHRGNRGIHFDRAPDLAQNELIGGGVTRSHFLIDSLSVVIRWATDTDQEEKIKAKHRYFLQLLTSAAGVIPDLQTVVTFLDDDANVLDLWQAAEHQHAKPTDKATVRIGGKFPVEDPRWYPWWDTFRASLQPPQEHSAVCLVTGQHGLIMQTHPKVRGLIGVGGAPTGSMLVSFDKDAFTSYGLVQGANAPMHEAVAMSYARALEHLLEQAPTLANVKVLHWFSEKVSNDADPFAFLTSPEERADREASDEARRVLESIRQGDISASSSSSSNRFYAVLVSAVSARIMIRGWYEGTYDTLKRHIAQWFDDLMIVARDGGVAPAPAFWRILSDLTATQRDTPSPLVKSLWESAVFGRPLPRQAAQMALERIRQSVFDIGQHPTYGYAVLKAFLIRHYGQEDPAMSYALNPDRPEVAYQAGRLLAVMGRLQNAANPGVNVDVVTRFYAAASTNPAVTFGR